MAIVPDTKDWTWVLERPCPECGFDASSLPRDQVAPLIRVNADAWQRVLAEAPDLLRRRPRDDRWSPLEYGCHVRDVFQRYEQRLQLMLTQDDPQFPNWDQDRTAVMERYNDQDPAVVAAEIAAAANVLAATFDALEGATWDRRGSRSDGARFDIDRFGRYMIHDPVHHLWDVTAALAQVKP